MYYEQKIYVAALSLPCLLGQASVTGRLEYPEVDLTEEAPHPRALGCLYSQVRWEG